MAHLERQSSGIFAATSMMLLSLMRAAFGEDGRHDPEHSSGVLVLNGAKIVADRRCSGMDDHAIDSARAKSLPQGRFIER